MGSKFAPAQVGAAHHARGMHTISVVRHETSALGRVCTRACLTEYTLYECGEYGCTEYVMCTSRGLYFKRVHAGRGVGAQRKVCILSYAQYRT